MKKDRTIFDYLNNLYYKKFSFVNDSEVSGLIWPINRMLSMEKALLETISYLTRYLFTLGPRYYKLLYRVIPQSRPTRNKYIKVEKEENSELVDRYVQFFKLSKKEVRDYLKVLFKMYSKDEVYAFVGLENK